MGVDTARVVHSEHLDNELRELVCIYCEDLIDPNDALQLPCGHAFCSGCILYGIERNGPLCPVDKKEVRKEQLVPLKVANQIVYRMLGRTEVRCCNFGQGCNWRGELSEEKSHVSNCTLTPTHCQCCQQRGQELKNAKEMISAYERLVTDYDRREGANEAKLTAASKKFAEYEAVIGRLKEELQHLEGKLRELFYSPSLQSQATAKAGEQRLAASASAALPISNSSLAAGAAAAASVQPLLPPSASSLSSSQTSATAHGYPTLPSDTSYVNSQQQMLNGDAPFGNSSGSIASSASPLLIRPPVAVQQPPLVTGQEPWRRGMLVATLQGHNDIINSIIVGKDNTLYSASVDGTIRIWRQFRCTSTLTDHRSSVNALVLSSNGNTLYSCSDDATIRAWREGVCVATLESGNFFSKNPVKLALLRGDRWSFAKAAHSSPPPADCDGDTLISAYYQGGINVFENMKKVTSLREQGKGSSYVDVVASPDGTIFYSGSVSKEITVYRGGAVVGQLEGHTADVHNMTVAPDGTLFSSSMDGTVRLWKDGVCAAVLQGLSVRGNMVVGKDGVMYCAHLTEPIVMAWKGTTVVATFHGHSERVTAVALSQDGSTLFSGDRKGNIKVWRSNAV